MIYELDGFFAVDVTDRLNGTGYKLLRFAGTESSWRPSNPDRKAAASG